MKDVILKNRIFILILFLSIFFISVLYAESNEWGARFKQSMENRKHDKFEPEIMDWVMNNWRNHLNKIYDTYNYYIKKLSEGIDITKEKEIDVIPEYFFDGKNTEEEMNKAVEFYIYAFKHSKKWQDKMRIFINLVKISYAGNGKAKDYIFKQRDNLSLPISLRLRFIVATLFWDNNPSTIRYLLEIIKKAQDVETTNIKYSSPNESAILSAIRDTRLISKIYDTGKSYNYVLPLIKQMIFSRSGGIQRSAVTSYYFYTNKAEMKKIYKDCWAKVHDKNTPRKEFLNALYGLQALYFLQDTFQYIPNSKNYAIGFKEISSYFVKLGGLILKNGKWEWSPNSQIKRLSSEEKKYFQNRLRSK